LQTSGHLCSECFLAVGRKNLGCPVCGRENGSGLPCLACAGKTSLNRLIWWGNYSDPVLKRIIEAFKYRFLNNLAVPLGEFLIEALNEAGIEELFTDGRPKKRVAITFIPLSAFRLRWRGFNQAELLARQVAGYFRIPLLALLRRKYHIPSQVSVRDPARRRANIKGVFEAIPLGKKFELVFLVDDVSTTHATLEEAARVLKTRNIAEQIWGLVIAS